ncbi:sigma-70 family RNA polymerase sigma factor [Paenibacillus sp. TRM 82003]|nr:sigma-70 family RNA polymerase sigma factor [Paenibacillus sp. TRM 82003]
MDIEQDQALVERAKQGDTEAFGELIEQYRDRARGWAERMTGDPFLAEDVVQDALIRAFLHLGTLADTSRFRPWLHRIVRNQANMRLRRGGPHRNERPFASFGAVPSEEHSRVDWDDLDNVLSHLSRSAAEQAAADQNPEEHWLRKELYETVHALLHCLTRKEQDIFKAYFFRQLRPEEIASLFDMSTGSIYTYLHRSRRKLRQEHVRVSLGLISERKGVGTMARSRMLPVTEPGKRRSLRMSLVESVRLMLAMIGDDRDEAELMGLSGFAFRMKISNKTTYADGIYVFDWRETIRRLFEETGYDTDIVCGQLANAPVPLLGAVERFPVVLPIEEAVLPFIRGQIDLGRPALIFDTQPSRPHVHEWAVVYGYDDGEGVVWMTDPVKPQGKSVPYDEVVSNPLRFLVGIRPKGKAERPAEGKRREREQARRAIRFAVDYARKGCRYRPNTSYLTYTSGLAAYDRWIEHLQNPEIAPNRYGMGQLASVYAEAKRYAAAYLKTVPLEEEEMRLVLLASEAYEQAADALDSLSRLVPFVRTADVLSAELRESCAEKIARACVFERAAIAYLENSMAFIPEAKGEFR